MKIAYLQKADENLDSAELLFNAEKFNASANRAYYAAFQSAIFALSSVGATSEQNPHEWVQSQFVLELIHKRKVIPSEFRSYLSQMIQVRNQADYKPALISKKVAEKQLRKARRFVQIIKEKLPR